MQPKVVHLSGLDEFLAAECDRVANLWEGTFDSASDLRCIRDEGETMTERCIDANVAQLFLLRLALPRTLVTILFQK